MPSLCSLRTEKHASGRDVDLLIVFASTDRLASEELESLVNKEVQRDLAPEEIIIVARRGAAADIASSIPTDRDFVRIRNRIGKASLTVIGFGATGNETSRATVIGNSDLSDLSLDEIGRRMVTAMFRRYGGFVEANASYHFLNPSGRHTDRFIRLSNLLVSSAEISAMAMTVLPMLTSDAEVVHVDTPAMFPVVAAINDHLRSLAPRRSWLRCENFRSYLNVRTHDFTTDANGIVLISASSSGSMARIVADRGVDEDKISHVLFLGDTKMPFRYAIDLAFDKDTNPEGIADERETFADGQCALCDDGSIPVSLKGDQFDMGGPEFEPLTVLKKDAPAGLSDTMERLARHEALRISTSRGVKARQYLLDVGQLLGADAFIERAKYLARRYVPSSIRECIILDASSGPFARLIVEEAECAPRFLQREDLDQLGKKDVDGDEMPLDGRPIVIIGAVIESGRSLRDVSRDLRTSRPNSPQIYLVGVAKNASPLRRDELRRTLVQTKGPAQHALGICEELLLPASGTPNAWLAEHDFLNALRARTKLSPTLEERLKLLTQSSQPLIDNLFVSALDPLRIQPGFVFWPEWLSKEQDPAASQADVFYTISSVLQRLRTNPPKPGGRAIRTNWFQQTRLDPANLGRFNDGVIQASLLRAARPVEIDFSARDDLAAEAGRALRRIVEAADRPRGEAACEVLIAIGSRRLRLPKAEMAELLRERASHPPLVAELAAGCRMLLLERSATSDI